VIFMLFIEIISSFAPGVNPLFNLDTTPPMTMVCASLFRIVMAKKNIVLIKLVSSADTGFYYVTKKNPKTKTEKLSFRKYDPVARKHVVFNEAKIK
jgi:large subunit ribosomal protein L33